ncbi:glutathione S-transferase [Mesorhizobium sp. A556]
MKLFYAQTSPFVRKVMVVAHELGIADRIEQRVSGAHPIDRVTDVVELNPLGKIPLLITDDGSVIYDSAVICEYLNSQCSGDIIPNEGEKRWEALTLQSLGNGMLDASMLARYEVVTRPEEKVWQVWIESQLAKVRSGADLIETKAKGFGDRVDIGTITLACAFGYLDFRFPDFNWRNGRPLAKAWYEMFLQRPSMLSTLPPM